MPHTATIVPVFYFRPDPTPGTPAGDSDPAYELGNIQNISTTLNPEAVEIVRTHGDVPRAAGMPQVSQSVNYEITISELGLLPMLIITGAGGHNIKESAGIVTDNEDTSPTAVDPVDFNFKSDGMGESAYRTPPATTGDTRIVPARIGHTSSSPEYNRQRWYRIGNHFMLPERGESNGVVVTTSHATLPTREEVTAHTLKEDIGDGNGGQYFLNRSLGLIRFDFREADGDDTPDPGVITVQFTPPAINSASNYRMAQWMVSRFRTTYGRGDLYCYDDERRVVWGHTNFRCTVWCSGDITFNPTEVANATITVAVETDDQGQCGYQFGDTSRLPFG